MSSYYKEIHDKMLRYLEAQGDRNIPDLDTFQFRFQCPSDCWGTCCGIKPGAGGIGVALTPWDLYRLAQGLGKSMQQTLYDHCALVPDGVHYPAVMLANPLQALPCEFLIEDHKCGIRAFAPEVCRGAPVTSNVAVSEEGVLAPHYWLRYPHADCAGQDPDAPVWTARDWVEANGVQYEMDHDHQVLRNLLLLRYNYDRWKTPEVDGVLFDLLYTPDRYAPADLPGEELIVRSTHAALEFIDLRSKALGRRKQCDQAWSRAMEILQHGTDQPPLRTQRYMPLQPPAARRSDVGRNDACPCGSGRKYKKCCGR